MRPKRIILSILALALVAVLTAQFVAAWSWEEPIVLYEEDYDDGPSSYSRVRGWYEVATCYNRANYTIINTDWGVAIYAHAKFESGPKYVHHIERLTEHLQEMLYDEYGDDCWMKAWAYATKNAENGPTDSYAYIKLP